MKNYVYPLALLLLIFSACNKSGKKEDLPDPAFSHYVQAFTSGMISREATISVYLNQPVEGEQDLENIFSFIFIYFQ